MNQTLYLYKGFQFLQKIDIACIFMNKDFKIKCQLLVYTS